MHHPPRFWGNMKIVKMRSAALVAAGMALACANEPAGSQAQSQEATLHAAPASSASSRREGVRRMALRDDCDPADPTWAPTGGCLREDGDVTRNEFNALLNSPLSAARSEERRVGKECRSRWS